MYDADTVALISEAPQLSNLNLSDLPQQLTNAYASVVAARIRLQDKQDEENLPEDAAEIITMMKRLAFTQEAFVSASTDRENRAAAAFVAGAAHHVSLLAERTLARESRPSKLGFQAISPEISATLLFLIAEASADAAEMAKSIVISTESSVEAALLASIVNLANGELQQLVGTSLPALEELVNAPQFLQPLQALHYLLLQGVRALAAQMLGKPVIDDNFLPQSPENFFGRVRELCIEPLDDLFGGEQSTPYSLFPGPLHLANLLTCVAKDLSSSALVAIPSPININHGEWLNVIAKIAERRPYLWRNHRQAIAAGYLEPGTSAVVSFPTGAGKSTLAELKIAVTLLRGLKVVFLAPTLALVDQIARSLAKAFPTDEVQRSLGEEALIDFDSDTLPAISVMTPERCLAIQSFNKDIFSNVGLLVFDECHLLHPRENDHSRRAIDAMLCVLNFTSIATSADLLLLSAMMTNAKEIAGWIQSLTSRPCIPLALTWKPTRQVRGCVVYGAAEISQLRALLQQVRSEVTNIAAPASLKRQLEVQPFGFFCLRQTWQSNARKDYALLPLLDNKVLLGTGTSKQSGDWYLTPNGNQVAAAIAEATARQQLKTLIFTQTIPLANSANKILCERLGQVSCQLTDNERALYAVIVDEAGGSSHVYIEVDADGNLLSSSACHHGLLLAEERELHESLYRRPDGINVLVATSTLAQGMNLPSEVVIIAGDSRFDPQANRMERLEAHELLNAAGRAGRAGEASYGFVLVVPSKVVDFNDTTNRIHGHWADLKAIFAQSDQCLVIVDPLESLLDQVHGSANELPHLTQYFIRRLPVGDVENGEDVDTPARTLLTRSFGAYRARIRGDQEWINTRVEAIIAARQADPEAPDVLTWSDRLAATSGVPVAVIRELGNTFDGHELSQTAAVTEWRDWFWDWLAEQRHQLVPELIRDQNLKDLFGAKYEGLESDEKRGQYVLPRLIPLLTGWMAGKTLVELELTFGTTLGRVGKCESAREFILRIVPELAYAFGLPGQVYRSMTSENGQPTDPPLSLGSLAACIREGVDSIEKLAFLHVRRGAISRRAVHTQFALIEPYVAPAVANEEFGDVIRRVEDAVARYKLVQ